MDELETGLQIIEDEPPEGAEEPLEEKITRGPDETFGEAPEEAPGEYEDPPPVSVGSALDERPAKTIVEPYRDDLYDDDYDDRAVFQPTLIGIIEEEPPGPVTIYHQCPVCGGIFPVPDPLIECSAHTDLKPIRVIPTELIKDPDPILPTAEAVKSRLKLGSIYDQFGRDLNCATFGQHIEIYGSGPHNHAHTSFDLVLYNAHVIGDEDRKAAGLPPIDNTGSSPVFRMGRWKWNWKSGEWEQLSNKLSVSICEYSIGERVFLPKTGLYYDPLKCTIHKQHLNKPYEVTGSEYFPSNTGTGVERCERIFERSDAEWADIKSQPYKRSLSKQERELRRLKARFSSVHDDSIARDHLSEAFMASMAKGVETVKLLNEGLEPLDTEALISRWVDLTTLMLDLVVRTSPYSPKETVTIFNGLVTLYPWFDVVLILNEICGPVLTETLMDIHFEMMVIKNQLTFRATQLYKSKQPVEPPESLAKILFMLYNILARGPYAKSAFNRLWLKVILDFQAMLHNVYELGHKFYRPKRKQILSNAYEDDELLSMVLETFVEIFHKIEKLPSLSPPSPMIKTNPIKGWDDGFLLGIHAFHKIISTPLLSFYMGKFGSDFADAMNRIKTKYPLRLRYTYEEGKSDKSIPIDTDELFEVLKGVIESLWKEGKARATALKGLKGLVAFIEEERSYHGAHKAAAKAAEITDRHWRRIFSEVITGMKDNHYYNEFVELIKWGFE